jgi:hypothetical protein
MTWYKITLAKLASRRSSGTGLKIIMLYQKYGDCAQKFWLLIGTG